MRFTLRKALCLVLTLGLFATLFAGCNTAPKKEPLTLTPTYVSKTKIWFEVEQTYDELPVSIMSIDLLLDGEVVQTAEDVNVREFAGLENATTYTVRVTYAYIMDGETEAVVAEAYADTTTLAANGEEVTTTKAPAKTTRQTTKRTTRRVSMTLGSVIKTTASTTSTTTKKPFWPFGGNDDKEEEDTAVDNVTTKNTTSNNGTTSGNQTTVTDKTEKDESTTGTQGSSSTTTTTTKTTTTTTTKKTTTTTTTQKTMSAATKTAISQLDFTVEVPSGRDPVILQLTDTQIIDSNQSKSFNGWGASLNDYWATNQIENRLFKYMDATVATTKPDLILLTGDLIYGIHDHSGAAFQKLIAKMESYGVPWAPVFGNHEAETNKGIDWLCAQFEAKNPSKGGHCLFKQRTLSGNGNYSVGLVQGNELKRVFFMLDTQGCGAASAKSKQNSHFSTAQGLGKDQINWFTNVAAAVSAQSPKTRYTFAFHIANVGHINALQKYGYKTNTDYDYNAINVTANNKSTTGNGYDFGYIACKANTQYWGADYNASVGAEERIAWHAMMRIASMDSIVVGHEHRIAAGIGVYTSTYNKTVYYQYGLKVGTYDSCLWWEHNTAPFAQGKVISVTGSTSIDDSRYRIPIVGGTVMKLKESDATIAKGYNCYVTVNPDTKTVVNESIVY